MSDSTIRVTNNYDIFEFHIDNRPMHSIEALAASMRKNGFLKSGAIHCEALPNGRFKVIRGHHRLICAKMLGLPVYFIVEDVHVDISDIETPGQNWNTTDFVSRFVASGNEHYAALVRFHREHRISLTLAAGLLVNEPAGSDRLLAMLRSGAFKVTNVKHAAKVVDIIDTARTAGVKFATHYSFASAVSVACRVHGFDAKWFKRRLETYPSKMQHRGTTKDFVAEIESLYNFASRNQINLSFLASKMLKSKTGRAR